MSILNLDSSCNERILLYYLTEEMLSKWDNMKTSIDSLKQMHV